MADKKKTAAARKRESVLLLELQNDHGYALIDPPKGKQVTMMFSKVGKKARLDAFRLVTLAVPLESALAKALKKRKEHASNG